MKISGKAILITGANRGIGRALVHDALSRGAKRVYAGTRAALHVTDERVTPLTLDVTNIPEIQRAAEEVLALDVLINNAGVATYHDINDLEAIEQHLDVNLFGTLNVTRAFLTQLEHSKGAIVNNLSLVALAPLPIIPGYSISKAAALNMTQSLRALVRSRGISVHAAVLGPIDTDMNRGFEIPKATPESAARGIFDGLEQGEEDIFPDPASRQIAEGWHAGVAKALEREFAALMSPSISKAPE